MKSIKWRKIFVVTLLQRCLKCLNVSIVTDDNYTVSLYSPAGRKSFNCRKDCETTADSVRNTLAQRDPLKGFLNDLPPIELLKDAA